MSNFTNNLRNARKERKMSTKYVTDKLCISKAVLSTWEIGKHQPDLESLSKLADLYKTTIDYLLGRTHRINQNTVREEKNVKVSQDELRLLHGQPVYSPTHGWFLVNATENKAIFADFSSMALNEINDCVRFKSSAYDNRLNSLPILTIEEIAKCDYILVEPICEKDSPFHQLAGVYKVINKYCFVESDEGHRFIYTTYKIKWVAFRANNLDNKIGREFIDLYYSAYDEGYEDGYSACHNDFGNHENDL